jgi:hypothetical protein
MDEYFLQCVILIKEEDKYMSEIFIGEADLKFTRRPNRLPDGVKVDYVKDEETGVIISTIISSQGIIYSVGKDPIYGTDIWVYGVPPSSETK